MVSDLEIRNFLEITGYAEDTDWEDLEEVKKDLKYPQEPKTQVGKLKFPNEEDYRGLVEGDITGKPGWNSSRTAPLDWFTRLFKKEVH